MSSQLLITDPKNPMFTFFVPWTRLEYADKVLSNINAMYLDHKNTEVVFYVDTDDKRLWKRLYDWAILNQYVFNGMKLIKSGNKAPDNISPLPRRERIVKMREDSKQYITSSHLVFSIEDDTDVPNMAFEMLRRRLDNPNIAYAQGVQQGRWGMPVLGAWRVDDIDNPTLIETLPFEHDKDMVDVDGGGMFCYATPTNLYKEHKYYSWAAEPGGPDFTYGLELRRMDYRCVTDYRIICPHYTDTGVLVPYPQNTYIAKWQKQGDSWVRDE